MTVEEQVVDTNPQETGSSFDGLWQVFTAPGAWFKQVKEQPKTLVPYIAVGILTLTFFYLMSDLIAEMQLEQMQKQAAERGTAMPPISSDMLKWSGMIGGTIAFLLLPLISSGLALFWGNFVFAGETKFKQVLSVMLYSQIIFMVGALVVAPLALAKGSMAVSFSLAVLVADQPMESLTYVFLSKISLFSIWEIIAAGIGISAVYDISRNKGYMISVLSLGLLSMVHVLVTAIFV